MTTAPANARPRILVVDDDDDMRIILVEILERAGFATIEAADGGEALALVEASIPDAVLLDHGIPTLDGARVAERLKAQVRTRHVPIVMLSGFTGAVTANASRFVDAFVEKSASADTFLTVLRRVLKTV